jgi:hypothetical protein
MPKQHTPGPWRVTTAKVMAENGRAICLIENRKLHEGFQESSANASIIAAAPDLLAVLQEIVETIDFKRGTPETEDAERLLIATRAAIAKATGEA